MKREITKTKIMDFKEYLVNEEICGDHRIWLAGSAEIDKGMVIAYKEYLTEGYQTASVNAMLSSLNSFFVFHEWYKLRVKTIKIQWQIFFSKEKELTRAAYGRLLKAMESRANKRLYYILQTTCATCLPAPITLCRRISCVLLIF